MDQQDIIDWLTKYYPESRSKYVKRFSVSPKFIQKRKFYDLTGVGSSTHKPENIYSLYNNTNPTINSRGEVAQKTINLIFKELYEERTHPTPAHLLHVSCTHYRSPSAAQELVVDKKWHSQTSVRHLYHMGCYAAFPAIHHARGLNALNSDAVDIVHSELCSFHLDRNNSSPEQIVVNTLFADGAIRYSSLNESSFKKSQSSGLEVITIAEEIIPNTSEDMTWNVAPQCFKMTLATSIPNTIEKNIDQFIQKLFIKAGLNFQKDKDKAQFAIHPGGPKIIELIQKKLKISTTQIQYSQNILQNRGNMSSATLPHIWEDILNQDSREYVCSVAFGPGLTVIGAIFKAWR